MTSHSTVAILTDVYWPSCGGMEESIRSLASQVNVEYEVRIVTHANRDYRPTLLHQTVLLPTLAPYDDDSGNAVVPLIPSIPGRMVMLPFALWQLPLARRLFPGQIFDFLYLFYRAAFAGRLARTLRNVDLVHSFSTGHLAILASDVCTGLGKPLIQAPPVHFGKWGDTPRLLRAYANADVLVSPTGVFEDTVKQIAPGARARFVINPPLPAPSPEHREPPAGIAGTRPFLLFLGRREPHKGLSFLIEALRELRTPAHLVIAGPGDPAELPDEGCIDVGRVTDAQKHWLLEHCIALCVPSVNESFGMVYTEAMSYGKVVIAADIGPLREIVANGETGFLVDPGDIPGLRKALDTLLGDNALMERMSHAARERYQARFSGEHILATVKDLYRELLTAGEVVR